MELLPVPEDDLAFGVGRDVTELPHIFERFRQADSSNFRAHGGLGLGLAIVDYLVRQQAGAV